MMTIKEWMRLTPVLLLAVLYACTEAPQDEAATGPAADDTGAATPAVPEPAPAAPPPGPEAAATDTAMDPVAPSREPEALWSRYCASCHDPGEGRPGTMMLGVKKGEDQALIMGREDLPAEYIQTIVRGGLLEMAPFRPTEISDDELTALAEWIRTTPAPEPQPTQPWRPMKPPPGPPGGPGGPGAPGGPPGGAPGSAPPSA